MSKGVNKILLLGSLLLLFITYTRNVHAAISSCTATSNPASAQPNQSGIRIDYTLTNYDASNNIVWFRVTRPFSGITYTYIAIADWAKTNNGSNVVFSGGSISPYNSVSPKVDISTGSTGGSGNWLIEASDDPSGASPTTCTGDLFFEVSAGGQDQTPPTISGITVSGISNLQATISWTTSESATSLVEYGVEASSYPFNSSDATLRTSHSRTLTNLGANTTHYYLVCSSDAVGNQACTSEYNFTTSATSTATAAPITITTTTTTTVTATATPAPKEKVAPRVSLTTDFEEPFTQAPLIEGRATDNVGVYFIDYSTDGGENWLPVDEIDSLGSRATRFEFTPLLFEDDNYEIKVRAKDVVGNVGTSETYTLVIDRLPPRIGGNLLSLGPHSLLPNKDGVIIIPAKIQMKVTVSTVGGPTKVTLIAVDLSTQEEKEFDLTRSPDTGLWIGTINFNQEGVYQLTVKAEDGADNKTERDLNRIVVLSSSKITNAETKEVINQGEVSLYYQDSLSKIWTLWDAASFDQQNPIDLSKNGDYQFFLPPGTYYLKIKSKGYKTFTSNIFTLNNSTPINADFALEPTKYFKLGSIEFSLPDLFGSRGDIQLKTLKVPQAAGVNKLIGQVAPVFDLPTTSGNFELISLRGSPSVLTFVNTWSPQSIEQISIMDSLISNQQIAGAFVLTQEDLIKVEIFTTRGNYKSEFVVDSDGELVEEYNLTTLPMHFVLDRKGVINEIVTGVLNQDEFQTLLSTTF